MKVGTASLVMMGVLGLVALSGIALGGAQAMPLGSAHSAIAKAPSLSCLNGLHLQITPNAIKVGTIFHVQTVLGPGAPQGSLCATSASYTYYGLPPGVYGFNAPVLNATALVPGLYTVAVVVHSLGFVAQAHAQVLIVP